ncbi:LuxR C-terminal-related transcriptional regulator [Buttiauxella selenatireducens]|uniref:LuxR C-terminal-related transcriptional regulator n=1 Tax=Buttiauxella selenatireducens TaxID=3073902 RepID=A0ABY9S993_9ENTR|nr:LuxR C-terminal-related transcriptional regulator [Buttiauxella sp. R73]WMY73568.1 LuxR C-terminal-related transcriptional regulator [Buttiauxella sp. R73]
MKIIINDSNLYLNEGIKNLLSQCYNNDIDFILNESEENLKKADVIFFRFNPGDENICHARYLKRNNSVLIGIADKAPSTSELPKCIKSTVFLTKNDTTVTLQKRLSLAVKNKEKNCNANKINENPCEGCSIKKITTTEFMILNLLYDMSIRQIAVELGIPYKTAFSRKYNMMLKFNLKNKIDLLMFIQKFSRKDNFLLSPNDNLYYLIKK